MPETLTQVLGTVVGAVVAVPLLVTWSRRFWPRDPQRVYNNAQKRFLLARAGYRCEHRYLLVFRCVETRRLQADHIMPWSRGGRTSIENGQMLCGHHNRSKSNRIPNVLYRLRLRHSHRRMS